MEKVVSMIVYNLLEHMRAKAETVDNFANVHMILYVYGLEQKEFNDVLPSSFTSQEMNDMVALQVKKIRIKSSNSNSELPDKFNQVTINSYIETHWNNIHFVGNEKMKAWLSPSLLSFPLLATAVESSQESE